MSDNLVDKVVSQVFTEKALHDFYCVGSTCNGWERNVVDQPQAVKEIINNGAQRIAAGPGIGDELENKDIAKMIELKENGEDPSIVIDGAIRDFREKL